MTAAAANIEPILRGIGLTVVTGNGAASWWPSVAATAPGDDIRDAHSLAVAAGDDLSTQARQSVDLILQLAPKDRRAMQQRETVN